ncbi:ABC transporter ATP-binding protein [Patescibacteria group bacterium]|nr:ABC transporter ATP-binding protein [Patescibacteria group bacterium]
MKLIWRFLKKFRRLLIGALVLATINRAFSLLDPQIFRLLIDRFANRYQELTSQEFLQGVLILLSISVGAALMSRIAKSFQDYYVNVITERLGARMYAHSVEHSFSLPFAVFEDQRSGELLQKLEKARTDAQELVANIINIVFLAIIGVLFVLVYAFFVHWSIGLVYSLMIPLLGGVTYFLSKRIKKAQEQIVKETASLAGSTTETLRNVELVKSLGLEKQEISRLNKVNEKILNLELKKVILVRKFSFIQGTIINALRSSLLLLMLWLIFQELLTLGEFFSLLFYSFFIFSPLSELGVVATNYQETKASVEQLEKILNIKSEPIPPNAVKINSLDSISFQNVVFRYKLGNAPALKNISFSVKRGETIAFVGPSGSGKTTMVKLISGLYRPHQGKILYNNISSDLVDFESIRKRIGLVAQETQLFSGTIKENLLFVKPGASSDDCIAALQAASAMSILERGDKGLETVVGEGGIKLSGGERQRLAIARALLRNPDMLVFDEATSSLDSITEREITETIQKIDANAAKKFMTILVAHRLSTIIHAHTIYVFEKGHIVESGSHMDLLKKDGLYTALWKQQSAENINNTVRQ